MLSEAKPRRRSEKSRSAIYTATRELVLEHGANNFTIEAVADRAGVGRQTIYRWWCGRTALIADVLLADICDVTISVVDTGDLEADLIRWAHRLAQDLTTHKYFTSLRILTASAIEDTDTATKLRTVFSEPLREAVTRRMQIDDFDDAYTRAVADALVGGVVYSVLMEGPLYEPARALSLIRALFQA